MGQIQLTISLILIALFGIAIIGFAINFAQDNNSPIDIRDDAEISTLNAQMQSGAETFKTDSEDQYQSMIETTVVADGTAPTTGPFAVTPTNVVGVTGNIMKIGYTKIFGTGSGFGLFITAFISVILFMIGLFIYKTLRGLPD